MNSLHSVNSVASAAVAPAAADDDSTAVVVAVAAVADAAFVQSAEKQIDIHIEKWH